MFNKRYYTAGLYEGALLRFLNSLDPEDSCSCVRIYDCFTFAGHACLVMEKLQGTLVDLMMEVTTLARMGTWGLLPITAEEVILA